ncbi:MAG: SGNH/GDSL hydrolase family protein [Solirubrobacteraceae bacterium]
MSRRLRTVLLILVAVLALPAAAGAASPAPRYYLALGDSLSQGQQPDVNGVTRNTDQGYPDQLFQTERTRIKHLVLVKFGCGGETTTSMLTGHGNDKNAKLLHCNRTGGSQLTAAVRFLKAHHRRGEVPLVTIDIGANDVDGCAKPGVSLGTCIASGESSIKNNVPKILNALRRAAPAKTTLAGMTLYDPVLAEYFSPTGRPLAVASPAILKTINGELTDADTHAGFRTADVGSAFLSYDGTDMVSWEGQMIPVNVARVCSWTWACNTPPSGPNIHANKNGYAVIAQTFARAVGRLR